MSHWWGSKADSSRQSAERSQRAARRTISKLTSISSTSEDEFVDADEDMPGFFGGVADPYDWGQKKARGLTVRYSFFFVFIVVKLLYFYPKKKLRSLIQWYSMECTLTPLTIPHPAHSMAWDIACLYMALAISNLFLVANVHLYVTYMFLGK